MWGCIITLYKKSLSLDVVIVLFSSYRLTTKNALSFCYRFIFFLSFFPRETIKTEHGHVKTKLNSTGLLYRPMCCPAVLSPRAGPSPTPQLPPLALRGSVPLQRRRKHRSHLRLRHCRHPSLVRRNGTINDSLSCETQALRLFGSESKSDVRRPLVCQELTFIRKDCLLSTRSGCMVQALRFRLE